ncbi:MAG: CpaF family protein [Myxococcales bacterium]|nr:CpaF family protein [Myxococcales bacterium]
MAMRILDRLGAGDAERRGDRPLDALARRLHRRVIDRLDIGAVAALDRDRLRDKLRDAVSQILTADGVDLTVAERDAVIGQLVDEIAGLGPLEALLADPEITDILVNGPDTIYVERAGRLEAVDARFADDAHLINTISRIVGRVGRRIDEASPMVDARLPDGSRVNAIIPPLALDGATLSIRRFGARPLTAADLVARGALTPDMANYLQAAVRAKCNLLISGGTGAGKTTLLNALSAFIPADERIITLEDAAELRLQQPHIVRLESRPPNLEGRGAVSIGDLLKNALRMRPDRIIVGEVRGAEAEAATMREVAEGEAALARAEALRDQLTAAALGGERGRIYAAIEAARNLQLGEVHLPSPSPDFLRRFGGLAAWRAPNWPARRRGALLTVWLLLSGVISVTLVGVGLSTDWPDFQRNSLMFALPPTDLLLIWGAVRLIILRRGAGLYLQGYLTLRLWTTGGLLALTPFIDALDGPLAPRFVAVVGLLFMRRAFGQRDSVEEMSQRPRRLLGTRTGEFKALAGRRRAYLQGDDG